MHAPSASSLTGYTMALAPIPELPLRQVQRLQALGVMAGGLANDFNNLLTPILAYAGLLRTHLPEDSPGRAMLDQIEDSARRASEVTRQVLAFSDEKAPASEILDLSALVREVVGVLRSSVFARAPFL